MKRKIAAPVLLLALAIFVQSGCAQFRAKMEVSQGNELYNAKKYEAAIEKYKSALQKAPKLSTIYLNLGLSYMALYVPGSPHPKDKQYADNAIAYLKEYLKYDPNNPRVNEYLITMYLNSERMDDAIGYFEEHLKKNPQDTAAMQKLAFLYAKSGKFDESLRWYQRRAQVEPNNAEAYYVIGVICWEKSYKFADVTPEEREKLIQTGMSALERAMKLNPNYADAYLYMNLLYREKAKQIALDPAAVPEDKIDEYNSYLAKAKELMEKAQEIRKKSTPS